MSARRAGATTASAALRVVLAGTLAGMFALACDGGAGKVAGADAGAAAGGMGRAGECASCHMVEYLQATDPVHVDVNPTACGVCHSEESWRPTGLHHPFWALTGAHEKAKCFYCHQGKPPRFEGTPKTCVTCHLPEYDSSTYPGHATFPTTCADCHTTTAFKPATKKPPPPVPVVVTPPLASASAGTKLPKPGLPGVPKTAPTPTVRPTVVPTPTPPRVPTSRPPDIITRPSPRR